MYDAIGESHPGPWPPPAPTDVPDQAAEIEGSGLFANTRVSRHVWETTYSADDYIALLDTFSGHIAMDESKRGTLYRAIRERLGRRPDGLVRRHWLAILHVAERVEPTA